MHADAWSDKAGITIGYLSTSYYKLLQTNPLVKNMPDYWFKTIQTTWRLIFVYIFSEINTHLINDWSLGDEVISTNFSGETTTFFNPFSPEEESLKFRMEKQNLFEICDITKWYFPKQNASYQRPCIVDMSTFR